MLDSGPHLASYELGYGLEGLGCVTVTVTHTDGLEEVLALGTENQDFCVVIFVDILEHLMNESMRRCAPDPALFAGCVSLSLNDAVLHLHVEVILQDLGILVKGQVLGQTEVCCRMIGALASVALSEYGDPLVDFVSLHVEGVTLVSHGEFGCEQRSVVSLLCHSIISSLKICCKQLHGGIM